jgi:flagellar basal body-associated protein FliL
MKKLLSVIVITSIVMVATSVRAFAGTARKDPIPQTEKPQTDIVRRTNFNAAPAPKDPAQQADKIKLKVAKMGTGEKAKAKIKLRSGEKLKGYISSAGENDFVLTDKKSGKATTIAYADVDEIKKPGLSQGTKIALIVVVAVVATAAILAIAVVHSLNNLDIDGITAR